MKTKAIISTTAVFLIIAFASICAFAVTKTSTIRVEGMMCSKCSSSVEKALKATPGVEKVQVSVDRKEAVVQYDDEKVTEAKLREVINSTGFKAVEDKSGSE